jgi:hypothetical protein
MNSQCTMGRWWWYASVAKLVFPYVREMVKTKCAWSLVLGQGGYGQEEPDDSSNVLCSPQTMHHAGLVFESRISHVSNLFEEMHCQEQRWYLTFKTNLLALT